MQKNKRGEIIDKYKKPYLILFNAITDGARRIEELEILEARRIIMQAQLDAEEMILSADEDFE